MPARERLQLPPQPMLLRLPPRSMVVMVALLLLLLLLPLPLQPILSPLLLESMEPSSSSSN